MKKNKQALEEYIKELEDKIVEVNIKHKSCVSERRQDQNSFDALFSKLIHNLKNPIGGVYSFSDMILNSENDISPDKLKRYLHIIHSSSKFSLELLNKFAKFRMIDSPDFKINPERIDYVALLNKVVGKYKNSDINRKITITNKLPNNQISLEVDKKYMKIALEEILENAIRFSEGGSAINIELVSYNGIVETIISDEGIGILGENIKSVFKPFFIVNNYSNDKEKCIGLGLSIVQKIIKCHNGEVSIESEIGKGTDVKFKIK